MFQVIPWMTVIGKDDKQNKQISISDSATWKSIIDDTYSKSVKNIKTPISTPKLNIILPHLNL